MLLKNDYILLKNDRYVKIGRGSYDNGAKVWRWSDSILKIGKYCSIAHNVNFIVDGGYHTISEITSYPHINNLSSEEDKTDIGAMIRQKSGIQVGNDVWIGMNAIILPGIVIGNGATVAAGSVVTKDVPAYSVVGGNPATLIKHKHTPANAILLDKISWWDWSVKTIEERRKDFYLPVSKFIEKYQTKD